MTQHNDDRPAADPHLASNYAETMERWIAAVSRTSQLKAEYDQSTSAPVALPGHSFTLHIASDDGRLTAVDITDAVRRAHFTVDLPNGDPGGATDVHDVLPGNRQARLVHRIMLVTCHNPGGNYELLIDVDPAAERWLAVHAKRQGDDT